MLRNPKSSFHAAESLDYSSLVHIEDVNKVYGMPKVQQVVKDGRLISEVVFEVTPVEKMNEGLKVDDFALENLLANGYEPKRMDVTTTSFDQIDAAAKGAEAISKAHKQAVSEQNKQNVEPSNPE